MSLYILSWSYLVLANSFSSGYSFVYAPECAESDWVIHDSYTRKDLFISGGKYLSLKEEILLNSDNEITNTKMWTNMVILKANQFFYTTKVKKMRANQRNITNLPTDKPISIQHLQSIILYCDFSLLSTLFTATFRQIHETESLKEIKERNKAYYHLSKYLFQTIQGYGYKPNSQKNEVLYSGMGVILNMKNTDLYLRGPTSTSTELIIAQNFSKSNGVILELSGRDEFRFDTSWISRYPE